MTQGPTGRPWVELRVHGVSGTPPESLLGAPHATQVAGDDRSRFFRPADELGQPVPAADGHTVEAYHWGRWTAGSWQQGLWLLLIPFGIVNAAQFMLPGPRPDAWGARWAHAVCGAALRVVALSLTVLFALGLTVVLADLVGWQWQAVGRPGSTWWVALGLAAAGLGVFGLSRLGRIGKVAESVASPGDAPGRLPDLGSRYFFEGDPDSPTLRHLHLAAGLQVPAVCGWSVAIGTPRPWWVWALLVVPLGAVLVTVVLLGDPQQTVSQNPVRYDRQRTGRGRRWLAGGLLAVSAAVFATAVGWVLVGGTAVVDRGQALPSVDAVTTGLAGVATLAVLVLLGANCWLARATRRDTPDLPPPFRRFCAGLLGALAASIALFLGIGFTAAAALAVQRAVNSASRVGPVPGSPDVEVPRILQRVSYTWGVALAAVLLGVGLLMIRGWARGQAFRDRASAAQTLNDVWRDRVAAAMLRARWKNFVPVVVWGAAGLGVVLATAAVVVVVEELLAPPGPCSPAVLPAPFTALTGVSSCSADGLTSGDVLVFLGSSSLVGLAGALLFVIRGAVRTTTLRRSINTVWDVVSFWPRAVHPFVPPPYSQRVVTPLVTRIRWLLGEPVPGSRPCSDPASDLVLAAHSQGSLITALALLQLSEDLRSRVNWLTCGSQLRVLFPRAFPHYVTYPLLTGLARRHRWFSLYRDSDPIGGPVLSWDRSGYPIPLASCSLTGASGGDADDAKNGWWAAQFEHGYPQPLLVRAVRTLDGRLQFGREWLLLDPPGTDATAQTGAQAGLRAHSDYWRDTAWAAALQQARAPSVPDQQADG